MMNDLLKQIKLVTQITKGTKVNEVRESHLTEDDIAENQQLIFDVSNYYTALKDFFNRAERAFRYYRGDQWSDVVENDDGEHVKEETIITSRGKLPLKNNLINQIVNNLAGQFAQSAGKANVISRRRADQKIAEMLSQALQTAYDFNRINILDTNTLIDGLVTGLFIQKVIYKYYPEEDKEDLFIGKPSINRVFFNSNITDIRLNEIHTIGELHDMPLDNVVQAFAKTQEDEEKIRGWYSYTLNEAIGLSTGLKNQWNVNVLMPDDANMSRVIEVWKKKLVRRMKEHDPLYGTIKTTKRSKQDVDKDNQERIAFAVQNGIKENIPIIKAYESYEMVWAVKYITPHGHTLYEGETVYNHKSHPYILSFAQFSNGEAWGVVENIIDQQRHINRLISMLDFMMGTSAKGVLLVHEDVIPDDMNLDDFTDEWSRFDGVIKMKGKAGVPIPQQISANVTNLGVNEQLSIQFDLIEKISGVSAAAQGQTAGNGKPSSLYAQEVMNSSTNSKAMFDVFRDFRTQRDRKALKVITQFYDDDRYLSIAGKEYETEAEKYNSDSAKNLDYDVKIIDGANTAAYKLMIDDQLQKLYEAGAITIEMFLRNSSMPFADKLLEGLEAQKQAQSETQQKMEAQQNADPEKIKQVQSMFTKK